MVNRREKDALVIGDDSAVSSYAIRDDPDENKGEPMQEDYDDFWDSVYEATGALVRERDEAARKLNDNVRYWFCEVSNFGWRGLRGYKAFSIHTYDKSDRSVGIEFLQSILPNTDCTFYIYDDWEGFGLTIDNAHHDAPTGGEMYYCAPMGWMIENGYWWGINTSEGDVIGEIWEQVLYEWEEFLNEYCAIPEGGRGEVLDIEGMPLVSKFLNGYKLKLDGSAEMLVIRDDLIAFFDKYYSTDIFEAWPDYLQGSDMDPFEKELKTFLGLYGLGENDLHNGLVPRLKGAYDSILEYKKTGRNK